MTWPDAAVYCQLQDSFLAETLDEDQLDFLRGELEAWWISPNGNTIWWLGGTDAGREGDWYWIGSTESVGDFMWFHGEPNGGFRENYMSLMYFGQYSGNDAGENVGHFAICQSK